MSRNKVAFELRSELAAPKEARARLNELESLGPDDLAAVKTIVSLLVTRAMREDGGGPFAVRVDVGSGGADGSVRSSHGWASLQVEPAAGSRDSRAVLDAFASSWRVERDSVCFSVS